MSRRLEGVRVLIVEDEPMIALVLEDMLDALGVEIVETATTLSEAMAAASSCGLDAAILDINLEGEMSYPAAERLASRGVPFIFVTGYAPETVPPSLANAPVIDKPYRPDAIAAALAAVLGVARHP